ncbi:MAG: PhzF family phenazine biosynthesis protein [Actinomycetota bacterium]
MEFQHVDVFATEAFTGNSLTVFIGDEYIGDGSLSAAQLLAITREFRHFESAFLTATGSPSHWRARIFDLAGELDFAGHPLLGAAAVLHDRLGGDGGDGARTWSMQLAARTVQVETRRSGHGYHASMDQGRPEFGRSVTGQDLSPVLEGFGLRPADLAPGPDPAVVSTGLRYLVLPVTAAALAQARIVVTDLGDRLSALGAQFAYLLDVRGMEGRHWDNEGDAEDIATGSAAGAVGAYLVQYELVGANEAFVLHQGRFAGRASQLRVTPEGSAAEISRVLVSGEVAVVAKGILTVLPGTPSH